MKKALSFIVWLAIMITSSTFSLATISSGTSTFRTKDTADSVNTKSPLPDLVIESVSIDPNRNVFILTVRNVGTAPVASGITFLVEGTALRKSIASFTFSVPALAPGEATSYEGRVVPKSSKSTAPTSPFKGPLADRESEPDLPVDRPLETFRTIIIKAYVDSKDRVKESNETNNAFFQKYLVEDY